MTCADHHIPAVMPYFPYSRQSKRKSHRGAIVARMLANLMEVAGVNHLITIDLHASQSQGFFKCPVDNLIAEPTIAKWIKGNVQDWKSAVIISKNPGGTKRVTALADALQLSFGIVTTERRRPYYPQSMENSTFLAGGTADGSMEGNGHGQFERETEAEAQIYPNEPSGLSHSSYQSQAPLNGTPQTRDFETGAHRPSNLRSATTLTDGETGEYEAAQSINNLRISTDQSDLSQSHDGLRRTQTALGTTSAHPDLTYHSDADDDDDDDDYIDEVGIYGSNEDITYTLQRARNVVTGRLINGHIVEDDGSPTSTHSSAMQSFRRPSDEDPPEHMFQSFVSAASSRIPDHGLGGTADATASDEEEEEALHDPELEHTITLVGDVSGKPVFIVDDIMDKAGSWIAAAETAVKRGGATAVYCVATHGLFGGDALEELDRCPQINRVVVTNSFPIPEEKRRGITKLVVLDVSALLSEAIRRNHHGESISALFQHFDQD